MSFESIPETLRQELSSEPLPVAEQWRELIGDIVPADVARHEPEDGGFLLSHPKQLLEAENCFEQAIVHAGSSRTVEPVLQALTLVFFLTEIPGDGDTFMLQVTNAGDTAHVVNWSHEEGFFTGPVAWDIPSVLRIVKVWESSDDTAKRREDLTPAFGRVNASPWPFSFISERLIDDEVLESETELNREGERPRNLLDVVQPRAWWLAHALLDQPFDANALKNQLEWDPTKTLAGPHMANFPPTGLYWLWRSYFFGEAWLDDIIAATRNSKSRLVRDAVKLVEELRNEQRREVGGIDLIKVRQAVQGILAKLRNPYPEELTSGSVKFVRDDSLVSHLSDAPAPHPNPPEPAKDQPLSPWWNTNYPAIGVSGDGRMLVSGHRAHPRAGKHPSIPRSIPSVFEIDAEGKVLMTSDADQVKAAHYVTNDLFVFAFQQRVSLFERVGTRGVATQQATTVHDGTLFTDEGRTIVRFSGFHNYNINGRDARLVEVFRVDGGVLKQMCKAELELPQAALVDGALVVGNTEKGVAFRADLSEVKTKDFQVPTLGKSFAVRPKLDAREGPEVAMEALNPLNDWAFPMPNGTCVIFKYNGTTFDFWIGDDQGARPFEPAIGGTPVDYQIFDESHAALIANRASVWEADFNTGKATFLFESAGSDPLAIVGRGLAQVVDNDLVLHRPSEAGYSQTRIPLGNDCKLHGSIMQGRVLALQAAGSPLVLLGVGEAGVHLLCAMDPADERASFAVEEYENPRGIHRLELVGKDKRLCFRGLAAALDKLADYPQIHTVPAEPWKQRPIA